MQRMPETAGLCMLGILLLEARHTELNGVEVFGGVVAGGELQAGVFGWECHSRLDVMLNSIR